MHEQLEIRLKVYKLVVRYAGRIVWCKADSSCRGRREADSREMQKRKKTEVNGRGLSVSPDTPYIMYKLSEPTSQALLEG